ncbi:heme exporter protein CcmD [Methylobacillus gramineus]|uniref:heme exporter protein CcmD n=1 Tax=Methylobacillus gramineus TaxID=755169 RepID=UPI001CFF9615|nr:heme exporter protein CcmD [Methylobacillus gramineus]MCB5183620.1 heme exporter protein CcmD [Methylobacillus gramineus]
MQWNSWSEFLAMGGYAGYVWGSFGLTLLVIICEVFALRLRRRKAIARVKQLQSWSDQGLEYQE